MAHVEHCDNTTIPTYYNVTLAVGPVGTAPNRRDAVFLVQYLLKGIADNPAPFNLPWFPPRTTTPFRVDGYMGPITASWIKCYQEHLIKRFSGYFVPDGRVDRAQGITSSITHTVYTILRMNREFQLAQPRKFASLEEDPEAPAELRAAIASSRASL
jgi:hypothetical protein